jgi:hypothetical protein
MTPAERREALKGTDITLLDSGGHYYKNESSPISKKEGAREGVMLYLLP